jgi:hypothetical protein
MDKMQTKQSRLKLTGRIQTNGSRCTLFLPNNPHGIVIKCPGLGWTLLRDVPGVRVTNGSPMIDVPCCITGEYLDDADATCPGPVFGCVTEVIVDSEIGTPINVRLDSLDQLSQSELENLEYFEKSGRHKEAHEVRERYLRSRKAW